MKTSSSKAFSIPIPIYRRLFDSINMVTILGLVSERSCYFCHSYLSNRAQIERV
jgi:hypothetical protein